MKMDEFREYKLRMGPQAIADLEWIADQYGMKGFSEAIRRAIGTEKYLLEQIASGHVVLIEHKETKQQRELNFI
jgi:hypothetical protein